LRFYKQQEESCACRFITAKPLQHLLSLAAATALQVLCPTLFGTVTRMSSSVRSVVRIGVMLSTMPVRPVPAPPSVTLSPGTNGLARNWRQRQAAAAGRQWRPGVRLHPLETQEETCCQADAVQQQAAGAVVG
jgi:hypothetical protein